MGQFSAPPWVHFQCLSPDGNSAICVQSRTRDGEAELTDLFDLPITQRIAVSKRVSDLLEAAIAGEDSIGDLAAEATAMIQQFLATLD